MYSWCNLLTYLVRANDERLLGDDEPPLNLASAAPRADALCRDKRYDNDSPCVEIFGHEFSIDTAADFSNILQPSLISGNDIQLVCISELLLLFKINCSFLKLDCVEKNVSRLFFNKTDKSQSF